MLSAFKPRAIVELKQRDKSKIESILAYGNRLLVGLNTGVLRVYRIDDSTQETNDSTKDAKTGDAVPKPRTVDLLREEEKFSRKPILQMSIVKEANLLISLSDSYVSFHDMETFALTERLDKTKGATLFAVTSNIVKDANTGIPSIVSRLAVVVKRKIILWTWHDMEISQSSEEFSLPHTAKSLTWATGTRLIVGLDPGFSMLDIETRNVSDVNRPAHAGEAAGAGGARFGAVNSSGMGYVGMGSWVPRPMSTRLSEGQLLLAKDVNTLFIDTEGKAIEKRQIPWANVPEALGYSYPYLLALQQSSRGVLEVRNPETFSLLQSISLPNATHLHVPQPYISLAHAGKGFLVSSDRCIWRMGAQDYDSQIKALVEAGAFEEALSLVMMLEDTLIEGKDGRLREIRTQKALYLFDKRRYREALDLFSEALASPALVIGLYPEVIAGHLAASPESLDSEVESVKDSTPMSDSTLKKKTSLLSHSKGVNKGKHSDTMSIRSNHPGSSSAQGKLEGKDLNIAVLELCAFLVQTRSFISRYLTFDGKLKPLPQDKPTQEEGPPFTHLLSAAAQSDSTKWEEELLKVATLVDTTLFRAYMLARPVLAGPLFRLDNWCSPNVVKDKLYESERYNDLIDFLQGKKLHGEALELLERFGKGEGQGGDTDSLRGPRRTVAYLQQLPFELIDLVLKFSEWPVRSEPKLGMEVFLADTENAEGLPRNRVLDFLQGIDVELNLQYLEHIIHELNDQTSEFHERLITRYLEKVKSLGAEDEHGLEWQEKLQSFLSSSQRYNKTKVLRDIPSEDTKFYESRATVLSKLSQHKQALQIYVFQIRDYEKAEDYCNRIYLSAAPDSVSDPDDPSQPESIYTTLLSLYLTPPSPQELNLSAALDLVSRHGSRLPALSTLSILPASLPIMSLESYFQGRMRAANSLARENAIMAALAGVEKTEWESVLALGADVSKPTAAAAGRNRRVVLAENRLCSVCNKRFGRAAVRVLPDGQVAHYGCVDRTRQDEGISTA